MSAFSNTFCDGSGPCDSGEVRVLPTGGDSNAILCRRCFQRELAWRRGRNQDLAKECQFKLPAWEACAVYSGWLEAQEKGAPKNER